MRFKIKVPVSCINMRSSFTVTSRVADGSVAMDRKAVEAGSSAALGGQPLTAVAAAQLAKDIGLRTQARQPGWHMSALSGGTSPHTASQHLYAA